MIWIHDIAILRKEQARYIDPVVRQGLNFQLDIDHDCKSIFGSQRCPIGTHGARREPGGGEGGIDWAVAPGPNNDLKYPITFFMGSFARDFCLSGK